MIWARISSWSSFCWLYRTPPSLATKNIINLISVWMVHMGDKFMKRCTASLFIWDMWIKTTMRYCLKFGRITIISKKRNKKCWQERTLVHCWCVYKLVQQYGNSIEILQKLKNETTIQSRNSTSVYLSRVNKNANLKKTSAPSCSPQHYLQ